MPKRIALFGGSFNPPGLHHRAIAQELASCGFFDAVVVVPCGPRPDKPTTNDVAPIHRATMCDLTFAGLQKTRVELFDLEQATFTRTHVLEQRFGGEDEVWHVVGPDLIENGADGASFIQRTWQHGTELWESARFIVVHHPDDHINKSDLPTHHIVVSVPMPREKSSTAIRETIFRHESIEDLVTPSVAQYISRYALYRGRLPEQSAQLQAGPLCPMLVVDMENPQAAGLMDRFLPKATDEDPNCIVVIGGDGTMLHAIRKHWRRRLPFIGINAGHRGFLLNNLPGDSMDTPSLGDFRVQQLPLLYVEVALDDGTVRQSLAFNDAWAERATGQTAWLEVRVDGVVRIPKLIADGILLATPAGSTAYARAMGAAPLPPGTPALILVGSNVLEPTQWKVVHLPLEATVDIAVHAPDKRPVEAFVDGASFGRIRSMRMRVSRIAAAELGFLPSHDFASKLTAIQFP